MTVHVAWDLQAALFAALSSDADLLALLGAGRIHDHVPRDAAPPYVHLGRFVVRDWSTATEPGSAVTFGLTVWSREAGRSQVMAICRQILESLDGVADHLADHDLISLRHLSTEAETRPEENGVRARIRCRALLEPSAT